MIRLIDWLPENTAACIFTSVNRQYLTGFESSLGYLLVSKNDACLFVDGRYILAAKQAVKDCRVELFVSGLDNVKSFVKDNGIKTVFCEDSISVAQFNRFVGMFEGAEVTVDGGLQEKLTNLRKVKTDYEVECIIKAQRIAEKAFDDVLNYIKVGVAERDIAAELEYRMKKYGSEIPSFETIAVAGLKSAMPHGVPDGNIIKNGDFITMDFGAVYNGYHSDMTRTVAVGFATDKMQLVYNTVLNAQLVAEKAVRAGVNCCDVDFAAREVIKNNGFGEYFTHSNGHGVGLEIHEKPNVAPSSVDILRSGMVISNEPGIYIEGEFGVRIEDMLLVTDEGSKNLTNCEKSLIIL
ncbi:MAG: aminopeptidase P family protein [Clostridia bacterium]|nr:aminopeptidase P family protein [Clostridia bacterium]